MNNVSSGRLSVVSEPRTTPCRSWLRGTSLHNTNNAFLPALPDGVSCVVRGEMKLKLSSAEEV